MKFLLKRTPSGPDREKPYVTLTFMEWIALTTKAAKCDRLVAAYEAENKTA